MKAKLEPRKTGTIRPVTRWKTRVPTPAVKRATAGLRPVRRGTKTVAPNMATVCWRPRIRCLGVIPGRFYTLSVRQAPFAGAPMPAQAGMGWCYQWPPAARASRNQGGTSRPKRLPANSRAKSP